jgi:hypothetical protein
MRSTVSVAEMCHHIETLIAPYIRQNPDEWGLQIIWLPRTRGARVISELGGAAFEIRLPRIRSSISYAIALHEIGHIRGKHQRSRDVRVRERWAWQWAWENALFWSPPMDRVGTASLCAVEIHRARLQALQDGRSLNRQPDRVGELRTVPIQ